MASEASSAASWARHAHGVLVIAKKNALLYYGKPPVLIFGVLFPVFFFLAFRMGRDLPAEVIVPGMVAMSLWFVSSAVGPLVTPWERGAKTYERLISSPVSLKAIVLGDALSGFAFGFVLAFVPIGLGLAFTGARISSWGALLVGLLLGGSAFSALGVLLGSPPAATPSHIMMLSNLVRLPLLFVSGVFVPIAHMPTWARWVSHISPLSYAADLIRRGFGEQTFFPLVPSILALLLFASLMYVLACRLQTRCRAKGL